MGCGTSVATATQGKDEKTAVLIQRWFRRYMARLEMRRRYTWNIFQSIEYAGEQDQLQLSSFFSFMLNNVTHLNGNGPDLISKLMDSASDPWLENENCYNLVTVPETYTGPRLSFPLSVSDMNALLGAFKEQQTLHARYVLQLLHETRKLLKQMPNIIHLSTTYTKEITICGDLHGQLDDLLLIFYKNGLPSAETPYVFNGDFVDRGKNSVEVMVLLFAYLLLYPDYMHLNRGNHEDHLMNLRYGFTKEVMQKYKIHGCEILQLFQDVFSLLPIATIIDGKILIVHGGISDQTDLDFLSILERHKSSRQIVDILWSDPKTLKGCCPNTFRGGGCYFGPDVTRRLLLQHGLQLLIRSHECKQEGYELCHSGQVITIFSASNYYEEGSNRGAYIKVGRELMPRFYQYQVSRSTRKLTLTQRVRAAEGSAFRALKEKLFTHRSELILGFQEYDHNNTGTILVSEWAQVLETGLRLDLPWRTLRPHLVRLASGGRVDYQSCFEDMEPGVTPNLADALFRYRKDIEIIFSIIDKDQSGLISIEEFRHTWHLFSAHLGIKIDNRAIDDLARSIDFNKDGSIDFNEFLEAFRVVHKLDNKDQPVNRIIGKE
uniref:Serine/threonine-protein phosphatase n=1 Tax=Takifugu rubripes TaxID=31033 RepID=H2V3C0_TAKRU